MLQRIILIFFTALPAFAEVRTLTLQQALELAQKQSPDVMIARLDEQKAQAAVRVAHDPFTPKVYAGSGGAYTWGYPSAINGQPPSIVDAQTIMSVYNRRVAGKLLACGRTRVARPSIRKRRPTMHCSELPRSMWTRRRPPAQWSLRSTRWKR